MPALCILLASLTASRYFLFPIQKWGLDWWRKTFDSIEIHQLFKTSISIALCVTVIAVVIAFFGALAFARYNWKGRTLFQKIVLLPIFFPQSVLGLALLLWFNAIGLQMSWMTAVFAHLVWIIPVVTLVISIQVYSFDPALEEAAFDLGASRLQVFREVTLPVLLPGIVSGALFAFLLSWGNFPLSLFTTGADTTIPEYLYAKMVAGYTPGVPVLGTVSTFGAAFLLLGGYWLITLAPPLMQAHDDQERGLIMFSSLKGKSVLVTGGSKGIGKGIARVFAKAGCKVLIVARHEDKAEGCGRELVKAGGMAAAFAADVTDFDSMQKAADFAVKAHGGLDVLCANAGIFPQVKIEDMSSEIWDETVDTNLKGTFLSVKACLPALKKSGEGRIILTSSITGPVTGFPGWTHYGATKAGQLGFMRTACIELAKYGITVNAVLPGNIATEGLADLGADYEKTMAASIPLKRLGTVEDIGYAALYFATKEAGYVTGQTIIVDGGQILPESLEAINQA